MRTRTKTVVVTGAAGFIGSCVVRQWLAETDWMIVGVDALTYAGNLASLEPALASPRFRFVHADIGDAHTIRRLLQEQSPDAISHLAAESHVDRSIQFESGLRKTVAWYLSNSEWVQGVTSRAYRQWLDTNYNKRVAA